MAGLEARLAGLSPEKRELLLAKLRQKQGQRPKAGIPVREDRASYPMTEAQRGFWVLERLNPGLGVNNIPAVVRLRGSLDVGALRRALEFVVQRHEVLRAGFRAGPDGNPVQFVRETVSVELPVFPVNPTDGRSAEEEALAFVAKAATRPFDLAEDLLVRPFLVKVGPNEHLLSVTFHHIIADAWSVGVFVRDLVAAYQAFVQGREPALQPLPIQYFDFAAWHEKFLRSPDGQRQLDFWLRELGNTDEYLNLPTDKPKGPKTSYRGDHIPFGLGRDLSERVLAFCRERQITPYVFLLSTYMLLLAKYANQDVVRVGSPVANREKPELRDLIGLFINLAVLRSDLSDNPSFDGLVQRTRKTVLEAFDHSGVPVEVLIEKLYPRRRSGENPLAQVLFDFQDAPLRRTRVAGLEVEPVPLESGTVKYDLVLSVSVDDEGVNAVFGYRTDLFEETTIRALIGHYVTLVENALSAPKRPIWQLPMLAEAERESILVKWSSGASLGERLEEPVFRLFEAQVDQAPDAVALADYRPAEQEGWGEELTYGELEARANRLANFLIHSGVRPERIVGLSLDRSPDLFVGLLGILKSGAAYLPLDPSYPAERLKYMIKDSGVQVVVTQSRYVEMFASSGVQTICLDDDASPVRNESAVRPDVHVDLDNLAYLIYTSGSTGKPKAVMATHRGLVNHAKGTCSLHKFGPADRILQYISISFDAAGEEIYPALTSGASLVLPGPAQQMSGFDLMRVLEQAKVTVLHVPVPVWHYFVDFLEEQDLNLPDSIRLVLAGGEQPSIATLRKAARRSKRNVRFVNLYGPTETTIACNYCEIPLSEDLRFEYDLVPIGRPLPNVNVYVLDRALEPVPRGVLGEIYIGGTGVTRGYMNRPDLTAERFVPDPFNSEKGARMYKSGDLGRFNSSGEVVFAGRTDYQIKIRGFRVELGEIEAALSANEVVRQCAVVPKGTNAGEKKLVAYIVPANGQHDAERLREYLRARLPDYMIPAHFVFLDELPLTPTGKLDRRALPDPVEADSERSRDYVPPTTRLEKFLYEMWKDILGIEKIGIHDNFFELGGSSIQAASFVNRLQDALGEYVYIVAIYDAPTIAELRDYLRREYPEGVYRLTGEKVEKQDGSGRIGAEDVERLRSIIKSPGPYVHRNGRRKNPPAVFVLSAPRSGSTLTRAILGGHPRLFSPPELQLLNYNTLGERKRQLSSGRDDFWLDGTIRALMEIRNCSVEEARELMAELEAQDLPVQEFYRLMQEWLGDRTFVDKTPNYALSPHILQRAEEYFENNRYIHLIRHPYGVIPSFERARLHVFYPPFFTEEHGFTPRQLAELVWIISNQNILNFLKHIPEERQFRLYYEDLVTRPDETIRRICEFLEIEPHPDMFEPQKDAKKRMLDGLNDLSKMLGDVRFHEHKGISAERAYSWKKELTEDYLSDIAWELVENFGYEPRSKLEISTGKILRPLKPLEEGEEPPLSFSQQRLWFLDQLEPGSPFYNMPMTVRLRGELNPALFERALNEVVRRHEVLRTAFTTDEEGKPRAKVLERLHVALEQEDLSEVPTDEQLTVLTDLVREEARRPFDLSTPPLLRAKLYTLGERDRVLLLNMHHIVSDGLSLEIFLRELSSVYAAFAEGKPSPLEPLKLQYGAFAKWQREWLNSEALQKQLQYWKKQLQGVPELLQLPLDHPRPKVQSYRGAKRTFELSPELTQAVRRLAARFRTTPYVITLAAYAALLHRYSGQDAFCVGTPVSGRTRRELEELIGFFVNTLPLRFDFSAGESFADLLRRTQQTIQDALAHQDVPLERILDELDLGRDTSYNPLFQTVFVYEHNPLEKIDVGQLRVEPLAVDTGTAKFDLSLAIVETEDYLRCVWEYNTDLLDPETVEGLAKHFENLLHAATGEPERAVGSLSLLSAAEQAELVTRFSQSRDLAIPEGETVASLLQRVAGEHGRRSALTQQGRVLSYTELEEKANQLANFLLDRGVGPEALVGVALDRSFDLFVAILGTVKAGAAYVPIDPLYPRERIEHIVRDARLSLLLSSDGLARLFEGVVDEIVRLDTEWSRISKYPEDAPQSGVVGENLVYAIYTSGSTGVPKGVGVRQRALLNHILAMRKDMGLTPDDRVLQYISMSFDASGEEIYPTLASGATLVLPPSARELSAEELLGIVRSEGVTVLHLPVPIWHLIVDTLGDQGQRLPDSVRLVMVGGEAPSVQKLREARQILSHPIDFMNLYGPTEATITSTYYKLELNPERAFEAPVVPIGKPIANVRAYVLDRRLVPVPVGVIGELVVGGEGLARGYLGRPDQTAEVFVPDPFASKPGARMYRTGDLVRLTRSGDLVFAGRADSQVKVRGLRIELGEIEHHLLRHPGVREGVVAAKQSERGTRLVAYVVAGAERPSAAELRDFLKRTLPDYMVPNAYVFLDELPTTPSGKIDTRRLPEPDFGAETSGVEFVAPKNAKEKTLVEIWKQVLGLEKVGVRDNFFELGGDSILSIQVVARANQSGLKITPRQVFEHPTVEELAAIAEEGVAIRAEQGLVTGEVQLTPIQEWFFGLDLPHPEHWNQSLALKLEEPLDPAALEKAVRALVEHHDMLRARFRKQGASWSAEIPREIAPGGFRLVDLSRLEANEATKRLVLEASHAQGSCDLQEGPLFRVVYFRMPAGEGDTLLIVAHHLIIDGVSWRVLSEDLLTAYKQIAAGEKLRLPPKTTSFKYWAEKLAAFANSGELTAEVDYWNEIGERARQIEVALPVDFPEGENLERHAASVKVTLSEQETEALLREVPLVYHTQIEHILLAALVRAHSRWTGGSKLLVEMESHGREDLFEDVNLSRTVGWFTATYPVLLEARGSWSEGELIKQIKEALSSIPRHGLGFGLLRFRREKPPKLEAFPDAAVGFNYLGQFEGEDGRLRGLGKTLDTLGPERHPENRRIHELEIGAAVVGGQMQFNFSYSAERLAHATVTRWANEYLEELRGLIQHCLSAGAGGYTPSDFADAGLDDEELEELMEELDENWDSEA